MKAIGQDESTSINQQVRPKVEKVNARAGQAKCSIAGLPVDAQSGAERLAKIQEHIRGPPADRPAFLLLKEQEVAGLLAVSPKTLRSWRVSGRGPEFLKMSGGAVRYMFDDIQNFVDASRKRSSSEA